MSDPIVSSDDNSYLKKLDEKLKRVLEIQAELVSVIQESVPFDKKSTFIPIEDKINALLGEYPKSLNQLSKEWGNNNNSPVNLPHPKLEDKH